MKFLKQLFKITPLRLSLFIITFFLTVSLLHDMLPRSLPILNTLNNKSLDIKFKLRGPQKSKSKIVIVSGDEKAFQKFGQWPWDRSTVFAPMLQNLCKYNPRAVGLDIVWSESEKMIAPRLKQALTTSGKTNLSQALDQLMLENNGENALKRAIESCKNKVVLGYAPSTDPDQGLDNNEYQKRLKPLVEQGKNVISTRIGGRAIFAQYPQDPAANVQFYYTTKSALLNVPELIPQRTAQGFFTNEGDEDGNYRHSIFFFRSILDDIPYFVPSLTLRMAQKALTANDEPPFLSVKPQLPEQAEELRLELNTSNGRRTVPIDLTGKAIVNYRGPNNTYPNISIADVLSPSPIIEYKLAEANGTIKSYKQHKSEIFKDALVLVGVTALALYDIRPRPFAADATGVENHANILDNIVNDDFIVRPTTEMILIYDLIIFLVSMLFAFVITKLNAKWGAIIAASSIFGILYYDQTYLFNRNIFFSGHLQAMQFLFQYLGITVLKYMREEDEKKFIRSAFDKYVSPAIVDSMLQDPSKLKLGGDKKELSVLFSDIRGFTELSERVDVKVLTQFLNEYLGAMTDILQKNFGTLDKYIGDAVMGFWGAPVFNKDHAKFAVKTAVEMLAKLDELNLEFQTKYGLTIDIGIGINSGPVSVGNFGSSKVFEYTVIGDNVNLASRLEGINKYYGTRIIISETTYQMLNQNEFLTREVDTVKVKGKHKPVKIYEVFPDIPAYAPLKSILKTFNIGLSQYYSKQWEKAINTFKTVLEVCEKDKITNEMIQRCLHYSKEPPQSDWDGSWEMTSK